MTTGSSPSQTYRKYHLVPFGEYIPLKPFFPWLIHQILHIPLDDFSRGEKFQQPLEVGGEKVAMSICYEDAFGEEMIRQLPAATLLANVSNDAWFGNSIAPPQHQQMAQMRALETGRYMLRATNTGMTAIIDQHGRVTAHVPQFELAALHGTAQGFSGSTWFVRWGNAAVLVLAFAMLAGAWRKNKSRRRGPTA
jgi:apolipoprotein N-acyltransferase